MMCLMFQETRFQVQVLKSCKSIQESNEKVYDFKTSTASSTWEDTPSTASPRHLRHGKIPAHWLKTNKLYFNLINH